MKKKHGVWLTLWLLVMLAANLWFALAYLAGDWLPGDFLPSVPAGLMTVYGVLGLINVICVLGMFGWQKWAFYVFGISTVVIFILNLAAIEPRLVTVWGLLGVAILYLLLRPRWQFLR